MHRLRYHSKTSASSPMSPTMSPPASPTSVSGPPLFGPFGSPPPPPAAGAPEGRPARRGRGIAVLLGVAIVALLAGGAVAATRSPDAASTEELTALARRANLTQADFPDGWTADPPDPADEADADEEGRALAECLGAPYDDSPDAAASSFSKGGLTATSEFSVTRSLEWARADFATLQDGGAAGCFQKVLAAMLGADKPAGASYDIDVTRIDIAPLMPPAAARNATGFRATITLRRGELTLPMTFDTVVIRNDRLEATVGFTSVGTAFPEDLRRSLTTAVVNRLEH